MSTMGHSTNHLGPDQYGQQFEQVAKKYDIQWSYPIGALGSINTTRALHTAAPPNADAFTNVQELIPFHSKGNRGSTEHVCIIEKISLDWVVALGSAWDIDPLYFIFFLRNDGDYPTWAGALEREEHQLFQLR